MRLPLPLFTLPLLALAAIGQTPPPIHRDTPRLLVDRAEDGTIWALGGDYKLSLDGDGACFRARADVRQRAHTLTLGPVTATVGTGELPVAAKVAPVLHGPNAYFARGALVEVWQFAPDGARQNFLLPEPPPRGELRLRLPLGGDLQHQLGDGPLTFTAADGTCVTYGDWLACDVAGAACTGRPTVVDGAIELRLPAEFLATASYPLWIDPLVSSTVLLTTSHDIRHVDIAVDDSLGVLMTAHEETFAAGDEDVIARRYSSSGVLLGESAIDISNQSSRSPAVANHELANQFLVVWEQVPTRPFQVARILGRTHAAASASMGSTFTVNLGDSAGIPDVGGPSSNSVHAPYYVVWQEYGLVPFNANVAGRTVTPSGTTGAKSVLDNRTSEQGPPRISKRSGTGERWMVVYTTDVSSTVRRIDSAIVHATGAVLASKEPLTSGVYSRPDVDGDGTEFLTVFEGNDAIQGDNVVGVRTTYGATLTHVPLALSFHELTATIAQRDQLQPCVSRTKDGFTYAYMESTVPGGTSFMIHAASIGIAAAPLVFADRHVPLATSTSGYIPHIGNGLLSNRSFVSSLRPGSLDQIELAVFDQF
jgi:hypothetical protein